MLARAQAEECVTGDVDFGELAFRALMPPYVITPAEMDWGVALIADILHAIPNA
jgi:hypothetical protein